MIQTIPEKVNYLPLLQTLVGGLLTFLGGLVGAGLIQRSQRRAERENLGSAFYGEISALLAIIGKRGYIEGIEKDLEHIRATQKVTLTYMEARRTYFKVYDENVARIGLLTNPLPEKIVMFYTFIFAALEDFEDIAAGKFQNSGVSEVTEMLEELLEISNNVVSLGREIQTLIKPE